MLVPESGLYWDWKVYFVCIERVLHEFGVHTERIYILPSNWQGVQ